MEKSPEAFRTISEVADSMDLPQHVLRFWETRFPQIRPLKRAGGRRYYRPDDVERLRLIKRLLYDEGYTIKGVQKLFKEQGVQALTSGTVRTASLIRRGRSRRSSSRPARRSRRAREPSHAAARCLGGAHPQAASIEADARPRQSKSRRSGRRSPRSPRRPASFTRRGRGRVENKRAGTHCQSRPGLPIRSAVGV